MCSKFNCATPEKDNCNCGRCLQRNRSIMLRRFVMFSGTSPTLINFKNDDIRCDSVFCAALEAQYCL
jgi:hypothetical protein